MKNKSDFGGMPNQRKYWGKGIKGENTKRKDSIEYHPYTEIGLIIYDQDGSDVSKKRSQTI